MKLVGKFKEFLIRVIRHLVGFLVVVLVALSLLSEDWDGSDEVETSSEVLSA